MRNYDSQVDPLNFMVYHKKIKRNTLLVIYKVFQHGFLYRIQLIQHHSDIPDSCNVNILAKYY